MNKNWPILSTCDLWHGQSKTFKISLPTGQTFGSLTIVSTVKYGGAKITPQINYSDGGRVCEIHYSASQLSVIPVDSIAILDIIFQDAKSSMPYLVQTCHIKAGASYP